MKERRETVDEVQEDIIATEKKLEKKQKERSERQKKIETSTQEKLIAPLLLAITFLISYLIFLFRK